MITSAVVFKTQVVILSAPAALWGLRSSSSFFTPSSLMTNSGIVGISWSLVKGLGISPGGSSVETDLNWFSSSCAFPLLSELEYRSCRFSWI